MRKPAAPTSAWYSSFASIIGRVAVGVHLGESLAARNICAITIIDVADEGPCGFHLPMRCSRDSHSCGLGISGFDFGFHPPK